MFAGFDRDRLTIVADYDLADMLGRCHVAERMVHVGKRKGLDRQQLETTAAKALENQPQLMAKKLGPIDRQACEVDHKKGDVPSQRMKSNGLVGINIALADL